MRTLSLSVDLKGLQHELRTPLTGILGMAVFLSEGDLTREQQEQVETIIRCGNRLLEFIDKEITAAPVNEIQSHSFDIFKKSKPLLLMVLQDDKSMAKINYR